MSCGSLGVLQVLVLGHHIDLLARSHDVSRQRWLHQMTSNYIEEGS